VDEVLAIHRHMIEQFGGDPSLRDPGLLESAVRMPAAMFDGNYLHPSLAAMAAAYLFHLCKNHAFVEGNKRTSLAAAEVFLLLNDRKLVATNEEVEALTRGIAESRISKEEVVAFFREHVRPQGR
jgi:death-on-curing protein